ncbi:hypothetical protein C2845_PM01G47270 [Panicum miliaceum]|uniref:Uncharacterized protein n=1 Tax=Panicum miliaceum TaxID=4540 RepID=A0A3L6TM91_PANMI|nr:hypothetical protein C2845_PM01G47270 [Panicum miliaceum]
MSLPGGDRSRRPGKQPMDHEVEEMLENLHLTTEETEVAALSGKEDADQEGEVAEAQGGRHLRKMERRWSLR